MRNLRHFSLNGLKRGTGSESLGGAWRAGAHALIRPARNTLGRQRTAPGTVLNSTRHRRFPLSQKKLKPVTARICFVRLKQRCQMLTKRLAFCSVIENAICKMKAGQQTSLILTAKHSRNDETLRQRCSMFISTATLIQLLRTSVET